MHSVGVRDGLGGRRCFGMACGTACKQRMIDRRMIPRYYSDAQEIRNARLHLPKSIVCTVPMGDSVALTLDHRSHCTADQGSREHMYHSITFLLDVSAAYRPRHPQSPLQPGLRAIGIGKTKHLRAEEVKRYRHQQQSPLKRSHRTSDLSREVSTSSSSLGNVLGKHDSQLQGHPPRSNYWRRNCTPGQ